MAVSEAAFLTLKVIGVVVLVWLGVQALRGSRRAAKPVTDRRIVGEAFLTSAANPKLAVFFVALFPTFIPAGEPVLPRAMAMAALVIAFDFAWYLTLAALVSRAGRAVAGSRLTRRLEQTTGAILLALAGRLALERRSERPPDHRPERDREDSDDDRARGVDDADAGVASAQQLVRLLAERGEGRVAAEEAHHEADAEPFGRVVAVDERGDHGADEEAARDVDREGAPREDRGGAALDQAVEAVRVRLPSAPPAATAR